MILRNHFVYFNLHKRTWSLKARQSDPIAAIVKGRVTMRSDQIVGFGVTAKVSEAGRQRVLREKRKNVHAGLVLTDCIAGHELQFRLKEADRQLRYNPYDGPHFTDRKSGQIVTDCPVVLMTRAVTPSGEWVGRVYYGDFIRRVGRDLCIGYGEPTNDRVDPEFCLTRPQHDETMIMEFSNDRDLTVGQAKSLETALLRPPTRIKVRELPSRPGR